MRLYTEVVGLVRMDGSDDSSDLQTVGQIATLQAHTRIGLVRIGLEAIDAMGVERRDSPDDPMDLVILVE